jgi:hypothetical protein
MKRERKEVTKLVYLGNTSDGGFVFQTRTFGNDTDVKLTSYEKGVACLAFDYSVSLHRVAEIVAGCFAKQSNFKVDKIEIAYRNISVTVTKAEGRKNIICMLLKALKTSKEVNDVAVDMQICEKLAPLKVDPSEAFEFFDSFAAGFEFEKVTSWSKDLWFRNYRNECLVISSLKDGIIKVEAIAGDHIKDFVKTISRCFIPYNNMYGIKGIEVSFNEFSMMVYEWNVNHIYEMYERCCGMTHELWEKEWEEYIHSPEYIRKRAKSLKKECRHKVVLEKIRKFQKSGEFPVKEIAMTDWENCKRLNSGESYSRAIIRYTILWVQYMEYLTKKYGMEMSEIWDRCSDLANVDGVTGFMYGAAASIISRVWQSGEEFRKCYNSKWNYSGAGTVNPAMLAVSATA